MKYVIPFLSFTLIVPSLSGCNMFSDTPMLNFLPKMISPSNDVLSKLSGTWKDESGIISNFKNGNFQTFTTDTHEKLAEGSYTLTSNNNVNIQLRSLVRGTVVNVTCQLASFSSTMTCTPEDGQSFTLRRIYN